MGLFHVSFDVVFYFQYPCSVPWPLCYLFSVSGLFPLVANPGSTVGIVYFLRHFTFHPNAFGFTGTHGLYQPPTLPHPTPSPFFILRPFIKTWPHPLPRPSFLYPWALAPSPLLPLSPATPFVHSFAPTNLTACPYYDLLFTTIPYLLLLVS
ncbi:hypothetical protein FA13DRAFT_1472482 [Coprinellus micaceus]|uniref:Uncharacterized protein n=1 Tax=Coprinellus micaceus TaxID=71717 RepID=A0A4Y7SLM0_COPMI|nr:hypothetical protein FA13DRAFT_1472482 [Coprinellus micaceus]